MKPLRMLFFCLTILAALAAMAKKKVPKAPGTVAINDSLYIDATELSVSSWKEYQNWVKQNFGEVSEVYKNTEPNKTVWKDTLGLSLRKLYFDHPAYLNHPMVGISKEQAEAYCTWRTARVNEYIFYKITKNKYHPDSNYSIPTYYVYRLPKQAEFEMTATIGNKKSVDKKIKKGKIMPGNFAESREILMREAITYTTAVGRFTPNRKKIFDLYGNVAEMCAENEKAFGGSFRTSYHSITPQYIEPYGHVSNTVGFRCIAEKKTLPKSEKKVE